MKNKIDLVNDAFSMLLRTGVTVQATNADIELALGRLEDVMHELESRNMATGYNFENPPQPDSPSGLEDYMNLAVSRLLAVNVWPDFSPEEVNPMLYMQATQSQSNLSARLAQQSMLKYAKRMPLGSGNQPYQQYQKFYGDYSADCGTGCSTVSAGPTPPPFDSDAIVVDNLKLLASESTSDATGKAFFVTSFYAGWSTPSGGGWFAWSAATSKAAHNGVTVYAPEALEAWNGAQSDIAALLNWTGSGSGAWVRVNPQYHIFEIGGGNGIDDNSAQLQRLCNVAQPGRTVSIAGAKVVIDSDVLITDLRTLAGDWENPDMAGPANAQYFNVATSAIYLNSAATIRLGQSSAIRNALIYRKGMTFPVADESLFAGTAIDAVSSTASLSELLVMGFEHLFVGSGQRYVIDRVFGDNKNGIEISGSPDVCYVTRCHMWPFAANTGIYPNDAVNRSGKAYHFRDIGDWLKVSDCFSYAYQTGYDLNNVNSVTLSGVSADHNFPNTQGGSIGIHVRGTCNDVTINDAQTAAQIIGVKVATTGDTTTRINNLSAWSNADKQVVIDSGNVSIISGRLRNSPIGVEINSATSIVSVDGVRFFSVPQPYNSTIANSSIYIGDDNVYENIATGALVTSNVSLRSAPSAATLALPATANSFVVTGTTTISSITGHYTGRVVNLVFNEAVTVNSGTSTENSVQLSGNAPFSAGAGDTLTLLHIRSRWLEIARSVKGGVKSYTPVIIGSATAGVGTYSVQDGKYYEMGEMVFFSASITWSAHTGTGGMRISLPHSLADFGQRVPLSVYYSDLAVGASKECAAFVGTSGNVLAVRAVDPAGGVALEFFDTAGTINISGFYRRA